MKAKPKLLPLLLVVLLSAAPAVASDFDSLISQEIDGYLAGLRATDEAVVRQTAYLVSASGLDDPRLFAVVRETLLAHHNRLQQDPKNDPLAVVTVELLRALGSSGDQQYWPDLDRLMRESEVRAVRNRAKHMISRLSWYRQRNQIMADMSAHQQGWSLLGTRYQNLLQHQDRTFNRYGAEELYRLGEIDAGVTDWMAAAFEDGARTEGDSLHIDLMAWYCRVLVKLDYRSYGPTIDAAVDDPAVHKKIRKHCRTEIGRL